MIAVGCSVSSSEVFLFCVFKAKQQQQQQQRRRIISVRRNKFHVSTNFYSNGRWCSFEANVIECNVELLPSLVCYLLSRCKAVFTHNTASATPCMHRTVHSSAWSTLFLRETHEFGEKKRRRRRLFWQKSETPYIHTYTRIYSVYCVHGYIRKTGKVSLYSLCLFFIQNNTQKVHLNRTEFFSLVRGIFIIRLGLTFN